MPRLIIDGRKIEVPEGSMVIEAAERLGIMIPRFCYHKALGPVGACRLCAVKFVDGPLKGVEMSCMVEAKEGMVVSTTDPEAVEFRKYVIEWLMLNHPLDCPVCDEGGHCLLQDETVSGGHGIRRFQGAKRTYYDQYLGPFVQHEMNRCIHCFRCRRFYQEFSGYRDLGALQIGPRMYFGRFGDGTLESPFSGNLVDICPTGVFTDRTARYKGRRWDFERGPSLCLHCSLGCNTVASARYREVVRQEARPNEAVNGYFICDRGRFGFPYANHPERPRRPRVGEREVPWEEALGAASRELNRIREAAGPETIAFLGSARSSIETQAHIKRFCALLGGKGPEFFMERPMARKVQAAVSRLDERMAISMQEIQEADFILGVGTDPIHEAPMLALAMRQAYRRGCPVVMVDPRPIHLPFEFLHIPVRPGVMSLCLGVVVKAALERSQVEILGPLQAAFYGSLPDRFPSDALLQERLMEAGKGLRMAKRPVLLCGTHVVPEDVVTATADIGLLLASQRKRTGLFYVLPGANAFGGGVLSLPSAMDVPLLEQMEGGSIKALVVVENDPLLDYPDRERLDRALEELELLVVMDYLPSQSVKQAHILLPTITLFEGGEAVFMNQEGRAQVSSPIHQGGTPICQVSGGRHPPRTFLSEIPGAEPRPVGEILKAMASLMDLPGKETMDEDIWSWLGRENPHFSTPLSRKGDPNGRRLLGGNRRGELSLKASPPVVFQAGAPSELRVERPDNMDLLLVERTFGTEELSSYSPHIQQVEDAPRLLIHREDAARMALSRGERVVLDLPGGSLTVELETAEDMARGVAILPRHRLLPWQKVGDRVSTVAPEKIKRS